MDHGEIMPSPTFCFRIPLTSKAYSWIKEKEDTGKNVSRAIRVLIETHSQMFDQIENMHMQLKALRRQIQIHENQGSPDFRAMMTHDLQKMRRDFPITKIDGEPDSSNDS